jgi:hypothetical protein
VPTVDRLVICRKDLSSVICHAVVEVDVDIDTRSCSSVPVSTCHGDRGRTINNKNTAFAAASITMITIRHSDRIASSHSLSAKCAACTVAHFASRVSSLQPSDHKITGQEGATEKVPLISVGWPCGGRPFDYLILGLTSFSAVASLQPRSEIAKLYQMPSIPTSKLPSAPSSPLLFFCFKPRSSSPPPFSRNCFRPIL